MSSFSYKEDDDSAGSITYRGFFLEKRSWKLVNCDPLDGYVAERREVQIDACPSVTIVWRS